MVYDTFAHVAKSAAYFVIDITFPRTATIAVITGYASYMARDNAVVDGPPYIRDQIFRPIIDKAFDSMPVIAHLPGAVRHQVAVFLAARIAPYAPMIASIAAGCATSVTLNLIHAGIAKTRECWRLMFPHEKEQTTSHQPPINVPPGYRVDAPAAPLKRQIEIPICNTAGVHDIYFQASKSVD